MKLPPYLFPALIFLIILLSLLVAAYAPDAIEPSDDSILTWTVPDLATSTPTSTQTPGWYDQLPTPSYPTRTIVPSATPTVTETEEP
jgi:hypothetical protein